MKRTEKSERNDRERDAARAGRAGAAARRRGGWALAACVLTRVWDEHGGATQVRTLGAL